jgi:hypothetical protein
MTITPETDVKVRFGFWGFVLGAVVAITIGFVWGGWSTSSSIQKMREEAVLTSRVEICVAQFMSAPKHEMQVKEFQGTESNLKTELIEKGGWDRMPGEEKAAWGVASACVTGLEARIKAGA